MISLFTSGNQQQSRHNNSNSNNSNSNSNNVQPHHHQENSNCSTNSDNSNYSRNNSPLSHSFASLHQQHSTTTDIEGGISSATVASGTTAAGASATPHGIQDILSRGSNSHSTHHNLAIPSPSHSPVGGSGHSSPLMSSNPATSSSSSAAAAAAAAAMAAGATVPVTTSAALSALAAGAALPRFSGMYFNPAMAGGLHKLAANLAASDLTAAHRAAPHLAYWPQMVQNQANLWRDRLAAGSGKCDNFIPMTISCFNQCTHHVEEKERVKVALQMQIDTVIESSVSSGNQ